MGGGGRRYFLLMALMSPPGLTFDLSLHHNVSTLIAILKVEVGQQRAAPGWMQFGESPVQEIGVTLA